MKMVVTDGHTLNPGDLSWEKISSLGELVLYERTAPALIVERCADADIILTNKVPFSKATLASLPKLKMIAVTATGYNIIDGPAARERKIVVSNVPGYGTASVAQHVFALLLELSNHVGKNAATVAAGKWQRSADWCYTEAPVTELAGKILGVVGFGNIGQQVAGIARAFGMQVVYYNPRGKQTELGTPVDLHSLFAGSDIVSLHCPLTENNAGFVNAALLNTMKRSAILINTARGQLINEHDLADALNNDIIKGAALDVLSKEPPGSNNPLLHAKNCLITPHNAWISREARERIMQVTGSNISAFLQNKPVNVVNQ
jgi:glycerate dehydrogenase